MKDSPKLDAGQESTEVELSAYDLFAISPPVVETPASPTETPSADPQAHGDVDVGAETEALETSVPATSHRAPKARRIPVAAIVLTIGAVAVAAAAFAVIAPREQAPEPMQLAEAPPAPPAPLLEEPPPAEVEGPPVLFKNPFDESEVFEFPPGTSREEARAAVADLLIMRAQERQAMIEAQSKKRR